MKNLEVKILYENDSILVFDKPAGLTVNKAESQKDNVTLQDIVAEKYPSIYIVHPDLVTPETKDFYSRSGLVHRLDKDTSGIIIVAKNPQIFSQIQSQFKDRSIVKKYLALVIGRIKDMQIGEEFEINAPIKRGVRNREKFTIARDGRESETHFKVLDFYEDSITYEKYTLVECTPKTGRTHQIRVHLAALGHPVLGDSLYSGKKRYKKLEETLGRQFLHAFYIKFYDESKNEMVELSSPLPKDLHSVLESLR